MEVIVGYTPQEFEVAYDLTAACHPCLRKALAEEVGMQFDSNKLKNSRKPYRERLPFGLLIRHTMNEMNLKGENREAYKALIGHLYGKHGSWVASKRKKQPKSNLPPAQFPVDAPPPAIVTKPSGQLAWEI